MKCVLNTDANAGDSDSNCGNDALNASVVFDGLINARLQTNNPRSRSIGLEAVYY